MDLTHLPNIGESCPDNSLNAFVGGISLPGRRAGLRSLGKSF